MASIRSADASFAWPHLDFNAATLIRFAELTDHVQYLLGSKNALNKPLRDIKKADCSDWVRRAIWQLAEVEIPDGSWAQGEWAKKHGFKKSDMAACKLMDGAVRLVVRKQKAGSKGVSRHVWLTYMGKAYHCSSSNKGVAVTRLLPSTGREDVYVLTPPAKA